MKLRSKLLFSFIAATLVLVMVVLFMLRWSFERGATTYVRQMDQEQLAVLSGELANHYRSAKSWEAFIGHPQRWNQWLQEHAPRPGWPHRDSGSGISSQEDARHEQHKEFHPERYKPFFLLDEQHRLLAGSDAVDPQLAPIEVEQNGATRVVGYLGLPSPPARMRAFWKAPMVAQQRQLFVYFNTGALLVSVLAAIPLSARLVRRILQLHKYVGTLARGSYDNRLTVTGNDEIAGLAQHLNELAQSLADARHQRRQMTADISHELRTPVATLQANLEAMQDGVVPLSQDSVTQLHEQVRRLSKLIDDLYQLSLADAGALTYHKGECDLGELLESIVSTYSARFQQRGVALAVEVAGEGASVVWGDIDRLRQVFANLLENSLRYTNSPGRVRVAVRQPGDSVEVTISDSAPGVDSALYSRLTDRLFRIEDSRNRASGGAGLGLNLCAAIVQAHDGELLFGDSDLGGLAVTVRLPGLAVEN